MNKFNQIKSYKTTLFAIFLSFHFLAMLGNGIGNVPLLVTLYRKP